MEGESSYLYYAGGAVGVAAAATAAAAYYLSTRRSAIISPSEFRSFPLASRSSTTHNTLLLTFSLPDANDVLPLPTGTHLTLHDPATGTSRPYTPIPSRSPGIFTLLVKVYPTGKMTQYLDQMQVGESILAKGPSGRFDYRKQVTGLDIMGLVAGGTGITPMWALITRLLADTTSAVRIRLVYGNVREEDILLREELEKAAERSGGRLQVYFVLNEEPEGGTWSGGVGFVSKEMIARVIGGKDDARTRKVCLCGPPPMNRAMRAILESLGYGDDDIFKF